MHFCRNVYICFKSVLSLSLLGKRPHVLNLLLLSMVTKILVINVFVSLLSMHFISIIYVLYVYLKCTYHVYVEYIVKISLNF